MTVQDHSTTDLSGDSTDQDRSDFVPVAEAARRLGVSPATVKRRIRDGSLEAEPLSRPQGIEYRVRLKRDVTVALNSAQDRPAAISERTDLETAALTTSAHVTSQDMSAAITAAVAPLVERLSVADRQIADQAEAIKAQADKIADLREDRGRLSAENDALKAAQAQQEARTAVEPASAPVEPPVPFWERWGPAALALLAVALAVAGFWVR